MYQRHKNRNKLLVSAPVVLDTVRRKTHERAGRAFALAGFRFTRAPHLAHGLDDVQKESLLEPRTGLLGAFAADEHGRRCRARGGGVGGVQADLCGHVVAGDHAVRVLALGWVPGFIEKLPVIRSA